MKNWRKIMKGVFSNKKLKTLRRKKIKAQDMRDAETLKKKADKSKT